VYAKQPHALNAHDMVAVAVEDSAVAVAAAVEDTAAAVAVAKDLAEATDANSKTDFKTEELSTTNPANMAGFFYSSKVSTTLNSPLVTSPGPAKVFTLPKSPSKLVPK